MKFNDLKVTSCPECGCLDIVEESLAVSGGEIMKHTNGGRWENRKFLCGHVVEFVPNYSKPLCKSRCRRTEEYLQAVAKYGEEQDKLRTQSIAVDDARRALITDSSKIRYN